MTSVEAVAWAALDRRLDPSSEAPVALALSGGGDSMALLWLAADWARTKDRALLAINVDHALNSNSQAWSKAAKAAAARAGAGWLGLEWIGQKPTTGLPAAARAARHRLLANAAREAGAKVLLTGHTADDIAESDWIRAEDTPSIGRLRDWSPSPAWPEGRGLFLLRPLLGMGREQLRRYLRDRGEPWIEDPANADPRYARSRARAALAPTVAPRFGSPDGGPVTRRSEGACVAHDGRLLLPRANLDAAILPAALLCAAGTDRPPRGLQVEGLLDRLAGSAPVDATLAGARLVADATSVQIGRDAGERFRGGLEAMSLDGPTVWDGRFEIAPDAPGLRVVPLGGVMAKLDRPTRTRLKAFPPWARGALPALVGPDGGVKLPRPFGDGAALATPLAGPRLAAACGLIGHECDIGDRPHGACGPVTLCSGPRVSG